MSEDPVWSRPLDPARREKSYQNEIDGLRTALAAAEAALGEVRRLCDAVLSELDRGALNHGDDWLRMDFKVIRRTATLPTERDEPGPEDYTAPRMPKSSRVVGRIRLDDTASDEGLREALAALYAKVRAALSTDTDQGGEQ